eukprot:10088_1
MSSKNTIDHAELGFKNNPWLKQMDKEKSKTRQQVSTTIPYPKQKTQPKTVNTSKKVYAKPKPKPKPTITRSFTPKAKSSQPVIQSKSYEKKTEKKDEQRHDKIAENIKSERKHRNIMNQNEFEFDDDKKDEEMIIEAL